MREFKGRVLLGDDMGLGKTIQSLTYIKKAKAFPLVVVCPASVKYGWESECLRVFGKHPTVLSGRTRSKIQIDDPESAVIILNYDIANDWKLSLYKTGYKSCIFDEGHNLITHATLKTKACRLIARRAQKIIVATGTPLTNRPRDLFPILNILRPDMFADFGSFAQKYCDPRWTIHGWDYRGSSNEKELNELLRKHVMIRRLTKDVEHQLPKQKRRVVRLKLSKPSKYKEAETDYIGWLKKQNPAKAKQAKKSLALVRLGGLKQLAARYKLKAAVGWINRWLENNPDEKLVVFGYHKKMLDALGRRIEAPCVRVDGSTPLKHRKLAVEQFQKDKKTRVFLANIKAAGTGLDGLQFASSTMAIVEFTFRPADIIQAEKRISRIGQLVKSNVYYLVAGGTIEEKICKLIQTKIDTITRILDGEEAKVELNIMELLMQGFVSEN